MSPALERRWATLVHTGTAFYALGMPLSTAMVAIGSGLLLLAALLRPVHIWQSQPWRTPVMAIGLALLAYIALRTVPAWHRINQYQELLLAPLLLVLWRTPGARRVFMAAWIAGCVLAALRFWWVLPGPEAARAALATHRISTGFVLAVAAYVLAQRAPAGRRGWPHLACSAFLALTVIFAVDGRTGVVVLLLLAAWAAWHRAPARWRVAASAGALLAMAAIAFLSPAVQGRIAEMQAARHAASVPGEDDSSAIRMELTRIACEAAREHWMQGVGYANYARAHEEAARHLYAGRPDGAQYLQRSWTHLSNPHDEYVLQLVGGGIAGLALFLAWLAACGWRAGPARAGVLVAFAVGCVFNSLLLDFMEGHAFVALLAFLLAEERAGASTISRVAVIATRQIGDVLLTTGLVRAARERWPQARIDVVGFAGTLGMLRGNPDVTELVEMPQSRRASLLLLPRLARRYDLALVTDIGDRAHLTGWLAAPVRSGVIPESNPSNWWKRMLLDHTVLAAGDRGTRHVADEKLDLLAPWGGGRGGVVAPPGAPLPTDVASALREGFVVVHAPSMWSYKQWPTAHFERLVHALVAEGRQVVLTGSASERDRECIAPLRAIAGTLDLSGRLDFNQLVTLLQRAALYIGPDTSVSHLAAAAAARVIAIYGPTNPLRWAPVAVAPGKVTVMQGRLDCVPCGRAGCEDRRDSRSDCLHDISPERVIDEARRALS